MPSLPPQIDKFLSDLDKKLHEPSPFNNALAKIEQKTGLKRLHIAGVVVLLYSLYLLFGQWAQLACNITGFLYPAYISIKAIESFEKEDDTQWLTYWVVFALLNVVEFFSNTLLYYFPFYWLLKCVFVLWLQMPTTHGAQVLYQRVIRPVHLQYNTKGGAGGAGGNRNAIETARKSYEENVKET